MFQAFIYFSVQVLFRRGHFDGPCWFVIARFHSVTTVIAKFHSVTTVIARFHSVTIPLHTKPAGMPQCQCSSVHITSLQMASPISNKHKQILTCIITCTTPNNNKNRCIHKNDLHGICNLKGRGRKENCTFSCSVHHDGHVRARREGGKTTQTQILKHKHSLSCMHTKIYPK